MDATTKQQRKRERVRAWKQANRDKVLAQKKRYRERHRAEIQESKKLYAAGHRPQINEYRCRYRQAKKCARELQAQHQLLVPTGSLSVSETAKDLLTEARARLASREATSSGGFFSLGNSFLFFFLSFTWSLLSLYLQRERGVFKNNGRPTGSEFGSNKELITARTKQGSSNTKDSTTRATANKFVSVDDSIAKPTSNEFVKAADDITIHVGESASKFEDGTGQTIANKFVTTANDIAIQVVDVSFDSTKALVHALITSRVDYCNSLLCGLPATQLNKIQRVLNAAARLVCRSPRYCHITPLVYNLHWLPVNLRIRFKVLLFVFKAIHGIAPSYISDLIFVKPNSSYNLRSSSAGILLAFPARKTKRTLGDRSFSVAAPTLWNELPRELRDLEDFKSFKQKLKTHLFIEAYS